MERELVLIRLTISYLVIASVSDIRTKTVDDHISVALAIIGLIGFRPENLWGLIPAIIMFAVAYSTNGRPGGADIKVFAALTLSCGLWKSMFILFAAQLTNLIAFGIYSLICRAKKKEHDNTDTSEQLCEPCRSTATKKEEDCKRQESPKAARLSMAFVPFITLGYLLSIFCTNLI